MEASEPKSVNPVLNIIGVNSLRLGGHHIHCRCLVNLVSLPVWIIDFLEFGSGFTYLDKKRIVMLTLVNVCRLKNFSYSVANLILYRLANFTIYSSIIN